MIRAWIQSSSTMAATLSLTLIPTSIVAIALAILSPGFGKTADPFLTYSVISLFALPFGVLGLLFSLFLQTDPVWKWLAIGVAAVSILFISWPVLAILLLMVTLKGPINPG